MADWRIAYNERPLGVGVHGVIEVYDDKGKLQRWFEGLAADSKLNKKPIGSEKFGDVIQSEIMDPAELERFGAEDPRSPNALKNPKEATTVYVGPQAAVESAMRAMTAASKAIDQKRIPYQLPLVDSRLFCPDQQQFLCRHHVCRHGPEEATADHRHGDGASRRRQAAAGPR